MSPLDYPNERYVRLYQRETADQALWCWQALACWPWLIVKADRSGVLKTRRGPAGLAALIRFPIEVVEPGVADLLLDGCVVEIGTGYAIPNYVEAQNAVSSESKRKADQRAREQLAKELAGGQLLLTAGEVADKSVTRCHDESRDVTDGHEMSLRSERDRAGPNRKGRSRRKTPLALSPDEIAVSERVLERLASRTGVAYRGSGAHQHLIACRLREGISELDLRAVVAYAAEPDGLGWQDDDKMRSFLRPETLFGPKKIQQYLPPARAWAAKHYPNGIAKEST